MSRQKPEDPEQKVAGLNACRALFERRRDDIRRVYVDEAQIPAMGDVLKWCAEAKIAYHVVGRDDLEKIAETVHHDGVCVIARLKKTLPAPDLLAWAKRERGAATVVLLEDVKNPHNVGAILRVCAHFGVRAVIAAGETAGLSPAAMRTAEGGAEFLDFVVAPDGAGLAETLRAVGFTVVATSSHTDVGLAATPLPARVLLLFGSEAEGLSKELAAKAERTVAIPGTGALESLNVATAASVILWEHWRAHGTTAPQVQRAQLPAAPRRPSPSSRTPDDAPSSTTPPPWGSKRKPPRFTPEREPSTWRDAAAQAERAAPEDTSSFRKRPTSTPRGRSYPTGDTRSSSSSSSSSSSAPAWGTPSSSSTVSSAGSTAASADVSPSGWGGSAPSSSSRTQAVPGWGATSSTGAAAPVPGWGPASSPDEAAQGWGASSTDEGAGDAPPASRGRPSSDRDGPSSSRGRPSSDRDGPPRGRPSSDRDGPPRGRPSSDRDGPPRGRPSSDRDGPPRGRPSSNRDGPPRGRPGADRDRPSSSRGGPPGRDGPPRGRPGADRDRPSSSRGGPPGRDGPPRGRPPQGRDGPPRGRDGPPRGRPGAGRDGPPSRGPAQGRDGPPRGRSYPGRDGPPSSDRPRPSSDRPSSPRPGGGRSPPRKKR